jgi:hypothetical protein
VLGSVSQAVDDLNRQTLLFGNALDLLVGYALTNALLMTYGFLLERFAYLATLVENYGFQKQLERSVKKDKNSFRSPPVPRSIEMLNGEQ